MGSRGEFGEHLPRGALACPLCGSPMSTAHGQLVCASRHAFDIARQGYVSLLGGGRRATTGDDAAMVEAREAFLSAGHYRPIADAVSAAIPSSGPGLCLDVAGGTGYYLAAVLDHHPELVGLSLDLSPFAARRAARSHPRAAAATADVWQPFPLRTGSVRSILSIFGPRNGAELRRVLETGGLFVVVTPTVRHLEELREPLGLIAVDSHKQDRLDAQLVDFIRAGDIEVEYPVSLTRADVTSCVRMGPSAHHIDDGQLEERMRALPDPVTVTVSVMVSNFVPAE